MARIPDLVASCKQRIEAAQRQLASLRALQPAALRCQTLSTREVPELQGRVAALEAQREGFAEKLGEVQESYGLAEHDHKAS